jgi:hypothetical protein
VFISDDQVIAIALRGDFRIFPDGKTSLPSDVLEAVEARLSSAVKAVSSSFPERVGAILPRSRLFSVESCSRVPADHPAPSDTLLTESLSFAYNSLY